MPPTVVIKKLAIEEVVCVVEKDVEASDASLSNMMRVTRADNPSHSRHSEFCGRLIMNPAAPNDKGRFSVSVSRVEGKPDSIARLSPEFIFSLSHSTAQTQEVSRNGLHMDGQKHFSVSYIVSQRSDFWPQFNQGQYFRDVQSHPYPSLRHCILRFPLFWGDAECQIGLLRFDHALPVCDYQISQPVGHVRIGLVARHTFW